MSEGIIAEEDEIQEKETDEPTVEVSAEQVQSEEPPTDEPNEELVDEMAPNEETPSNEAGEPNVVKPILYNLNISPAVRCVKIVARLINLELELRDLDVFNGEHLGEPFLKINPEHTVPTLDDNGLIIWDSHAISTYLIDKYAGDDKLYPKDLSQRARCNQRLFFNNGTLFPRFRAISRHVFSGGDSFPDDFIQSIHTTYRVLEAFLETDPFLIGDELAVADICTSVTVTCLSTVTEINEENFPKITAWLNRIKEEIPFYDEMNEQYVQEFNEIITAKMETNKSKETPE